MSVVAKALWDKFFMHYDLPEKILSDQGHNFESSLFTELCQITRIKKLYTTPYRPQTNGQFGKLNSTLIPMIGTLPPEAKVNWQEQMSTLAHAYNCMRLHAIGFSPYLLMYGRQSNLPNDIWIWNQKAWLSWHLLQISMCKNYTEDWNGPRRKSSWN